MLNTLFFHKYSILTVVCLSKVSFASRARPKYSILLLQEGGKYVHSNYYKTFTDRLLRKMNGVSTFLRG